MFTLYNRVEANELPTLLEPEWEDVLCSPFPVPGHRIRFVKNLKLRETTSRLCCCIISDAAVITGSCISHKDRSSCSVETHIYPSDLALFVKN